MDAERTRAALANNSVDRMRVKEEKSQKLFQSKTEQGRFVRKGAVQVLESDHDPAQLQMFEHAPAHRTSPHAPFRSAAEVEAARAPQPVGT